MTLTPSKAHNQFIPALTSISKSLETFGHSPMELVFTDNVRADKAELERALPELCRDVVPVPDESRYPKLELPSDWRITMLSSAYQINSRLNSMMEDIKDGEELYVGMDMEWSVDRLSSIQGRVAIISIAMDHDIYLLQVTHLFISMVLF